MIILNNKEENEMKYTTTRLDNGKYAVKAPKNCYYTDTVKDTQKEAEKEALIMSMRWYYDQVAHAERLLVNNHDVEYNEVYNLLA